MANSHSLSAIGYSLLAIRKGFAMRIAIMGTGGTGGFFGARLAQAGFDVTFIARGAHLQALRAHGLRLQGPNDEFVVSPVRATDNPAEVGTADVILFCVKAYDAQSAAHVIKPMLGANTVIIPVLNGVDHIETIGSIVGAEHVVGGTVRISSSIVAPGIIQWAWVVELAFGEMSGGASARCDAIADAWRVTNLPIVSVPDIALRLWQKFVMICGMAGACCLVRGTTGLVMSQPETRELLRQISAEAIAVGHAKGIPLPDDSLHNVMQFLAKQLGQTRPSLLYDLEHGKRLELMALNGAVSRLGKELGVPTPANDVVTAALKPYVDGQTK
jgi:2-dehydropantoate 2-reductase